MKRKKCKTENIYTLLNRLKYPGAEPVGAATYLIIPFEMLSCGSPVVYYPGSGCDYSIVDAVQSSGKKLDDCSVILQDPIYELKSNDVQPEKRQETENFINDMENCGVRVIKGHVKGSELRKKADVVYVRNLFGYLYKNNLGEAILSNAKKNAVIVGTSFDLDAFELMFDGICRLDITTAQLNGKMKLTKFGRYGKQFPELAYWVLKRHIKTPHSAEHDRKKFCEKLDKLVTELENGNPKTLKSFLEYIVEDEQIDYLRETLNVRIPPF